MTLIKCNSCGHQTPYDPIGVALMREHLLRDCGKPKKDSSPNDLRDGGK